MALTDTCGVGSPVHLDNQPASTVATLASVKLTVIRHISIQIPTKLNNMMRKTALAHIVKETVTHLTDNEDPGTILLAKAIKVF